MSQRPEFRVKTVKLLEETQENLHEFGLGNGFLNKTPKHRHLTK